MAPQKSAEQSKVFLCFMENHPDIAKGFSKGDKVKQEKLWSELADLLNASGPPTRDVASWKKTWCDWRRSIKRRMAENKSFLRKTGGGDYQQHILSPVEEQLAIVCYIFHAVDGVVGAKTYGGEPRKDTTEKIQEEPTTSAQKLPTPPPTAFETEEKSPKPKRRRLNDEFQNIMGEERKNFQIVGTKLDALGEVMTDSQKYLKNLSRSIEEIRSLKRKELEETKRHYMEMERIAISRNELKLEFLNSEKMKMNIPLNEDEH